MQETARKLCTDTLRLLGYIASKEQPTPEDLQLTLEELQRLMDSWKLESLLSVYDAVSSGIIRPSVPTLTVGTVATDIIVPERPDIIIGCWVTSQSNQQIPLAEARDVEFYRSWRNASISTAYPTYFVYQPSYPISTIDVYPMCSTSTTISIAYKVTPTIPQVLTDVINLSPGWIQALMYNLASNMALPLAVPLGQATSMIDAKAIEFKSRVKRSRIHPMPRAIIDPCLGIGRYSSGGSRWGYAVNSDQYNGIL